MAERIVSPGVFTREKDLSFLPQGVADIGAGIIGPTKKGPAFVPTIVNNFQQFEEMFGGLDQDFYVPFTVRSYLRSAGTVTIVRVLGLGGYTNKAVYLYAPNNVGASGSNLMAILAPNVSHPSMQGSANISYNSATNFRSLQVLSGSEASAADFPFFSLDPASVSYIGNVFSEDPLQTKASGKNTGFYLYKNFPSTVVTGSTQAASLSVETLNFVSDYQEAKTPVIQSQKVDGSSTGLFRICLRSHGEVDTNKKYKIVILNVKAAGTVAGSDYGSFSIQVREIDQQTFKETDDVIVEQYDNLNLDPKSANYFARKIGDRYVTIDAEGKLTYNGDWPNMSKHIRIGSYDDIKKGVAKALVPYGFSAVSFPGPSGSHKLPVASFVTSQDNASTGLYDSSISYGFNFVNKDNRQFLSPLPNNATITGHSGSNQVSFSLDDMNGSNLAAASNFGGSATFSNGSELVSLALSDIKQRKFSIPFQGGFDGANPAIEKKTGGDIIATNQQGFDCSSASASGSVAYKRAIDSLSNQDEFDINLLSTPGLIYDLHPNPINRGLDMVKARGDAFAIFDPTGWNGSISAATNAVSSIDTNYAAVYYPWVKVLDDSINLPTWVPPSVVIPGVISQNDAVAHEWFAPAGLNRGGINGVLEAKTRLTHEERDTLYEARVNPIASFPGQGVVVFGQKTLQAKPSALDRINVRRLLIRLKKFIASSSRYLVFENNTVALRNRFLNIVNPYLESVQSAQGLTAFRVVMDDSNNTPDVIDRNMLVGQIFIQPARAVEFIVLDFVVQPTGASFPS